MYVEGIHVSMRDPNTGRVRRCKCIQNLGGGGALELPREGK